MEDIARQLYVVSDIHIGGVYPDPEKDSDGQRGFRIATHIPRFTEFLRALSEKPVTNCEVELVVNGDFIDFLAEVDDSPGQWVSFTHNVEMAEKKLREIVRRDQPVFDALSEFLNRGHRLTILLGNHDIELALPKVRQCFAGLLSIKESHKFQFIFDGEAYVAGDVLIEHGNRYDKFNVVDHDGLRRVRSLQSRNQNIPAKYAFQSPPGSDIVATIMNPIKVEYPFIDLLKPETEAAIPVLLALEPGARSKISKIASIALRANKHKMEDAALPGFGGDIRSEDDITFFGDDISSPGDEPYADDPLRKVLTDYLGEDATDFMAELERSSPQEEKVSIGEDISSGFSDSIGETFSRGLSLMGLLLASNNADIERRLPLLLKAIRILSKDDSFNRSIESASEYLDAASELAGRGFSCVIFGHTHLPKDVSLANGARYINTGTWADYMKFPESIVNGAEDEAMEGLREFVGDLRLGKLGSWVGFSPTYARVDLGSDEVMLKAELCDYQGGQDI